MEPRPSTSNPYSHPVTPERVEELSHRLEQQLELESTIMKLIPWLRMLIIGAFGLGGWVATLEYRQHQRQGDSTRVAELEKWRERTDANRYTMIDASKLAESLSSTFNALDKRVTRNEDAVQRISSALNRIEEKLGTK